MNTANKGGGNLGLQTEMGQKNHSDETDKV